jgi:hypothetical protein
MQSAKTESLEMAKSELNNGCERLQSTVKELGSKTTDDRETFLVEKTRLEVELGSSTCTTDARIQELTKSSSQLSRRS